MKSAPTNLKLKFRLVGALINDLELDIFNW